MRGQAMFHRCCIPLTVIRFIHWLQTGAVDIVAAMACIGVDTLVLVGLDRIKPPKLAGAA